jgi:two-component system OmpR family sensor kinase/two-component system sensor histidine kinase BaeS
VKRSLKARFILSYLAVALITVLVVGAIIRLTSGKSLMDLVVEQETARLTESVQTYYSANGTLDGFFEYYMITNRDSVPPTGPVNQAPTLPQNGSLPPNIRDLRGVAGLVDTNYRALIPTFGYAIGETIPAERFQNAVAIKVDGQIVAWILPDKNLTFKLSAEEQLFLQRTTLAIGLAALAGVLVAVAMGTILAGGLIKPIRRLTHASRLMAAGDLAQQVPVTSQDELGELTATFNQMSADLNAADQQRKRLTADITHDLSTPLQIISGYMEMLEEGEVALTPQRVGIIKTEIDHLKRLVGDLSTLSQVESGGLDIQMVEIEPEAMVERIFQVYQPIAQRQGIDMRKSVDKDIPGVRGDEGRLLQVLKNLVENAICHTPEGGAVTLAALWVDLHVELQVADTGSGIAAEDLPYVFERFYRADKSRSANQGHLGLGLAICKALVTRMGGSMTAESAGVGQGTSMIVRLAPISED